MNFFFKSFALLAVAFAVYSVEAQAKEYVSIRADHANLKYLVGERAHFVLFKEIVPENPEFELSLEAFFPDQSKKIKLYQTAGVYSYITPVLEFGRPHFIVNVYLQRINPIPLKPGDRTFVETKNIELNVRVIDNQAPLLTFIPDEDTIFADDMPTIQVNYDDQPSGIDTSTFRAKLIDTQGNETDITSLFNVTQDFASVQFDESHKVPAGNFWIEVKVADYNENVATKMVRYSSNTVVPNEGFLVGRVVDPDGNPVKGAHVHIHSGGALGVHPESETDENGYYRVHVGQGGDFMLEVAKTGWTEQNKWATGIPGRDSAVENFVIKPLDPVFTFIPQAAGGTGVNSTNTVQFTIAPGSANQSINLNITQAFSGVELPGPLPLLSEFTYEGEMSPSGTTFSPAGLLRIKNEHHFPPNETIVFGRYDHGLGMWKDAGSDGKVTEDGEWIEFGLEHFSHWDGNHPVVPPTSKNPIVVSQNNGQTATKPECPGCRINMETGNLATDYELPGVVRFGEKFAPVFTYRSQSAWPLAFAGVEQPFEDYPFVEVPDTVQVKMMLGSVFKEVYYQGKEGYPDGDVTYSYRFLMDAKDAEGKFLRTGSYIVSSEVSNNYKNSKFAAAAFFGAPPGTPLSAIAPEPTAIKLKNSARTIVLNSRESNFGIGWTLQGLEKLNIEIDRTIVWEDGSGKSRIYTPVSIAPTQTSLGILGTGKVQKIENLNVQKINSMQITSMTEKGGTFYVADCEGNVVRAVSPSGDVSVAAGTGEKGFGGDGEDAKKAKLSCPSSVFATARGEILIADRDNARIRIVSPGGIITTVAGDGTLRENADGQLAKAGGIGQPTFVSQDKLDSVHFIVGNRVRFVDPRGKLRTLVAEHDAYYKAVLKEPSQIVYDEMDNPLIVDTGNNRVVQLYLQSGDVRIIAGNPATTRGEKTSRTTLPASRTPIKRPLAYARDNKTNVAYILDESGAVHVLTPDGRLIKTNYQSTAKILHFSKNLGLLGVRTLAPGLNDYISPPGDFTTLTRKDDGTYERVFPQGDKITYNKNGYITARISLDGKIVSYVYDNRNRLTQWILPDGSSYNFVYDLRGYLKEVTDPANRATQFTVTSEGQLIQIQNPEGKNRTFNYNSKDLLVKETDEESNEHQYVYSSAGLIAQEIYPDGGVRNITPRYGMVLISDLEPGTGTKTNPAPIPRLDLAPGEDKSIEGRSWKFVTDRFGNPTKSIDGLNRQTTTTADANGLPTKIQPPYGNAVDMTYTTFGEISTYRDTNTSMTTFAYHPTLKKISQITNSMNRTTKFSYNAQGNVTEIRDALNNLTKVDYLSQGRVEKITDAKNNVTGFEYNTQGLVSARVDALGNRTEYLYNAAGLQTQVKDSMNRITVFSYDNLNRLTQIADPDGKLTKMTYSSNGDLLSIEDAKGQKTQYTYNARHWVTSMTNALGQVESYEYDKDGLLTKKTKRDGAEIVYQYDAAKQLTKKIAGGEETLYQYNLNGVLNRVSDPDSLVIRNIDTNGNMSLETQNGFTVNYAYNFLRQPISLTTTGLAQNFYYNANAVNDEIRATISGQSYTWTRSLDELSRPMTDTLPNGLKVSRTYTALSQLQSLANTYPNQAVLSSFGYQYDSVGRRTVKAESAGSYGVDGQWRVISGQSSYGYDNLDRLTSATEPHEQFAYDFVGNRQFTSGTQYNSVNQLITDGAKYSFEYTANGEMSKRFNLVTGERTDYFWNVNGELIRLQLYGPGAVLKKEITFWYDGLGRRIRRAVNDLETPSRSYVRRFFYDGQNIVAETTDNQGTPIANYVHGPGIDEPIITARAEGTHIYTRDGLGSVREMTKANGSLTQRYRYSSFGVTTHELDESRPDKNFAENRYGFTGREIEDEAGLYYYRARYYDPELGRFISEDPLGIVLSGANQFAYVFNGPNNWKDPSGLFGFFATGGAQGTMNGRAGSVGAVVYLGETECGAGIGGGLTASATVASVGTSFGPSASAGFYAGTAEQMQSSDTYEVSTPFGGFSIYVGQDNSFQGVGFSFPSVGFGANYTPAASSFGTDLYGADFVRNGRCSCP